MPQIYIMKDKDGIEHEVTNMSKFCAENNIEGRAKMAEVAVGKRKSHLGWTVVGEPQYYTKEEIGVRVKPRLTKVADTVEIESEVPDPGLPSVPSSTVDLFNLEEAKIFMKHIMRQNCNITNEQALKKIRDEYDYVEDWPSESFDAFYSAVEAKGFRNLKLFNPDKPEPTTKIKNIKPAEQEKNNIDVQSFFDKETPKERNARLAINENCRDMLNGKIIVPLERKGKKND